MRICYREQQLCEDVRSPNILKTCLKPNSPNSSAAITHRSLSTIIHFQRKEKNIYYASQHHVRKNSIEYSATELKVTNVFKTFLVFFVLLQLVTCQEFLKKQHFSTLIQAEAGAPADRHETTAVIQEPGHFSHADLTGNVTKNYRRCRMCQHTSSTMISGTVHSGFHSNPGPLWQ